MNAHPTPVASGPSFGVTPGGSWSATVLRYSSTRLRAQYRSVPSSKITCTNETPKNEYPRTTCANGAASIRVVNG